MRIVAFCAVVGLSGCAWMVSATPYQVANEDGFGYSEFLRDDGLWVITYRGNGKTPIPTVERFAMCRAAEIVADRGSPLFTIVDKQNGAVSAGANTSCSDNGFGGVNCATRDVSRPIVTLTVRPVARIEDAPAGAYKSAPAGSFSGCQREQ